MANNLFSEFRPPIPTMDYNYHNMQHWLKVMHIDHENILKPHFGLFFDPNWIHFWSQQFLFSTDQVLDIITPIHNMHNPEKQMHFQQGNGKKNILVPFWP